MPTKTKAPTKAELKAELDKAAVALAKASTRFLNAQKALNPPPAKAEPKPKPATKAK